MIIGDGLIILFVLLGVYLALAALLLKLYRGAGWVPLVLAVLLVLIAMFPIITVSMASKAPAPKSVITDHRGVYRFVWFALSIVFVILARLATFYFDVLHNPHTAHHTSGASSTDGRPENDFVRVWRMPLHATCQHTLQHNRTVIMALRGGGNESSHH